MGQRGLGGEDERSSGVTPALKPFYFLSTQMTAEGISARSELGLATEARRGAGVLALWPIWQAGLYFLGQ